MADNAEVLTKKARPAWQLMIFITVIVLATMKVIDIDRKYAMAAASEVVSPLRDEVREHLNESKALRPIMLQTAETLKRDTDRNARNQIRICQKLNIHCDEK